MRGMSYCSLLVRFVPCPSAKANIALQLSKIISLNIFKILSALSFNKPTRFAGLTSMIHQSGTSIEKKPRISKIGHSEIRKVLYMPAMGFAYGKYKEGAYQSFVNRLNSHGKPKMVVIVALMRKILSIAQAVLKSQQPFDAALHKN